MEPYGTNFFDSVFPVPSFYLAIKPIQNTYYLKKYFDEEYIKYDKSTLIARSTILEIKQNKSLHRCLIRCYNLLWVFVKNEKKVHFFKPLIP